MTDVRQQLTEALDEAEKRPAALIAMTRAVLAEHPAETYQTSWDEEVERCRTCRYDNGLDWYAYPCPTVKHLAAFWLGTPEPEDDPLPYDPDDDAQGPDPRDRAVREPNWPVGSSEVTDGR